MNKSRQFIKTITFVMVIAIMITSLSIGFTASATTTNNISLNTRYSGTISSAGEVDYFTFTPNQTGYFTIETFGSTDTTLTFKQYDGLHILMTTMERD